MNKNSNNKKIQYESIEMGDEIYNYVTGEIEKEILPFCFSRIKWNFVFKGEIKNIILPTDEKQYITIKFKSGEIWIFSEH